MGAQGWEEVRETSEQNDGEKKASWVIVLNMIVTQWFSQFPMITAGPKDRAGFMLAPV